MTLSTISTRFPLLFSVKCFRLTRGQRCNKVIVPHEGHTRAFSRGSQRILGQELLDALTFAGCQTLRIQSYGMKTKIPAGFDLGDPNHPLSHTNCFDIGQNLPPVRTYPPLPSVMKLFRGRDELGLAGVTLQKYPMLQHLGFHNNMWYGSVHVSVQPRHENDDPLKFKVYPRLVHCFKGICPTLTTRIMRASQWSFLAAHPKQPSVTPTAQRTCYDGITRQELTVPTILRLPDFISCGSRFEIEKRKGKSLRRAILALDREGVLAPDFTDRYSINTRHYDKV